MKSSSFTILWFCALTVLGIYGCRKESMPIFYPPVSLLDQMRGKEFVFDSVVWKAEIDLNFPTENSVYLSVPISRELYAVRTHFVVHLKPDIARDYMPIKTGYNSTDTFFYSVYPSFISVGMNPLQFDYEGRYARLKIKVE